MEIDLSTLAKHYSDETEAYKLVEKMRWPNGTVCPHCGEIDNAYLVRATRKTTTGKVSNRRVWGCSGYRKQFSVLVGTIFHGSHVPLAKWLAFYMVTASKNGVAAWEIRRTLGVTQKTAWFVMHRIREAMKLSPEADSMTGTIVADETFFGGDPKNRHQQGRPARKAHHGPSVDKTPILSLINKESGEVRSQVVPDVTGATLAKAISGQVNVAGSDFQTDAAMYYRALGKQFQSHQWVDHSKHEYVRGNVSRLATMPRGTSHS